MNPNIGHIDDLAIGAMRMVNVDGRRLCLVRTSDGVFALDNSCPHEGYGLTQGTLKDDLLTCQWHNWKFDVTNGACVQGEEHVRTHTVDVDQSGAISVTITPLDPAVEGPRLLESLRRGIERGYAGQIARDTVRLLNFGVSPADVMAVGVEYAAPRGEWGWGHEMALASDCLSLTSLFEGPHRAFPLVQALGAIAEGLREISVQQLPPANIGTETVVTAREAFAEAVEQEETETAQAILLGALQTEHVDTDELMSWFIDAVAAHHLSYGHGAIYVQKAWELLGQIGWKFAPVVLGHLVNTLTSATREDTLPYMRTFMRTFTNVEPAELSLPWLPGSDSHGSRFSELVRSILDEPDAGVVCKSVITGARNGLGLHEVLDAAIEATSIRMLRYDTATEFDHAAEFGWLDITHGVTYAHAIRQFADHYRPTNGDVTPLSRLALFSVFLAHYTGRHERVAGGARIAIEPSQINISSGHDSLLREALQAGESALLNVHVIKTMYAATREHSRRPDSQVLLAATRFMTAPKLQHRLLRDIAKAITQA